MARGWDLPDVPLTIAIQLAWREIMANLRLNYGNSVAFSLPFLYFFSFSFRRPIRGPIARTGARFRREALCYRKLETRNLTTEQLL